jgi:membrane-associated phospholipid phosphatase
LRCRRDHGSIVLSHSPFGLAALTDFGDLAVLLPLAAVILVWLWRRPEKQGAAWWGLALVVCIGATAVLKAYFFACPASPELHSPSGHASLSTVVYGGLATIIVAGREGWRRFAAISAAAALILAIAASRIALSAHSWLEVALGLLVGVASLAFFVRHYLRPSAGPVPLTALLLVSVCLAVIFHGDRLRAEELLHRLSAYAHLRSIACPLPPNAVGGHRAEMASAPWSSRPAGADS